MGNSAKPVAALKSAGHSRSFAEVLAEGLAKGPLGTRLSPMFKPPQPEMSFLPAPKAPEAAPSFRMAPPPAAMNTSAPVTATTMGKGKRTIDEVEVDDTVDMHAKRARVTDPQLDMVETAQLQKAKEHYDSAIIRVQEQQAAIDREREELKQKLEASKAADARREEEFEQRMAKERKDLEIKITLELQAKATEAYEKWLQEEETNVAEAKAKVTQRAESLEAWEAELTKRTAEVEAASQAISKDRQALEEETKRLAEQKDVIGRTQAAIHEEQLRQKKRGEDLMAWDTELRRQSFGGVRPSTSSPQQAPEAQSNGGQAFSGLPSRDRLIQAIQAADAKKKQNAIASQAAQPVEKAKAMCEFYGVQNHTQDRRSVKQEYIGQQTASTENEMVDTKTSQANKLTNLKLNLSLDDVIARRKEMGEDGDPKYGSRGGNRGSRVGNRGRGHKKR